MLKNTLRDVLISFSILFVESTCAVTDCCGSIVAEFVVIADGVPRQQPHRRSGLATLPSVGAVP